MLEHLCDWHKGNRAHRVMMERALSNIRLNPAKVNDTNIIAYIQFSIKIRRKDGEQSFKVYPHHFANESRFGDDYIAAQLYVADNTSKVKRRRFFSRPWIGRGEPSRCARSSRMFLKMRIGRRGQVIDVEATDKPRPKSCVQAITEMAAKGKYIPAFFKGEPVEAFYIEKYMAESGYTGRDFID